LIHRRAERRIGREDGVSRADAEQPAASQKSGASGLAFETVINTSAETTTTEVQHSVKQ
jgi:hypothetical protein